MATGQPLDSPKATISAGSLTGSLRPGTQATPALVAAKAGVDLVAHGLDGLWRRPDEGRACVSDRPGEGGVLGQEPVAGMDRVGSASNEHVQDELGGEVALRRRLAAEGVGLVGKTDMESVVVELGVDGDRGDAELAAGPDDPHGDLAAVRDEHLFEHPTSFLDLASPPNGPLAATTGQP